MKTAIGILITLILTGCSEYGAEIISYGIANNVVTQTESSDVLVSGEKHLIEEWNITKKTQHVPNKAGIEFGMAYRLNETSPEATVEIEEIIIFPGKGLTNPKTGRSTKIDSEHLEISPSADQYFSYTLDHPWEAKSGTWVFQVLRNGKVVVEKEFYVQ
nr:DUF3859 domain-containing protein [uncultured Pseudomonas sp.]